MVATPMKSCSSAADVAARLSAPQGRARPAAIDDDLHLDPSARRGPAASLLLDQRVEGRTDRNGKPDGIELIVPDWFYQAVLDDARADIDRAYFGLTGGLDRWLYRIVRKHGGRQRNGWRFDFRHLHQKSARCRRSKRFAFELRDIIRRQPLPGYTLFLEIGRRPRSLAFEPIRRPVEKLWMASCHREPTGACHQEPAPRAIGNRNRV